MKMRGVVLTFILLFGLIILSFALVELTSRIKGTPDTLELIEQMRENERRAAELEEENEQLEGELSRQQKGTGVVVMLGIIGLILGGLSLIKRTAATTSFQMTQAIKKAKKLCSEHTPWREQRFVQCFPGQKVTGDPSSYWFLVEIASDRYRGYVHPTFCTTFIVSNQDPDIYGFRDRWTLDMMIGHVRTELQRSPIAGNEGEILRSLASNEEIQRVAMAIRGEPTS